ncbi:hypothetical protein [Planctomycetes bacterium Poly30]
MRTLSVLSLSLGCGFLAAGVSAWNAQVRPRAVESRKIPGFLGAADWEEAIDTARVRGSKLILLFANVGTELTRPGGALEDREVQTALAAFVPVVVWLDGPASDRELARRLDVAAAPLWLVLSSAESAPVCVDALEPVTGARFERYGLCAELLRAAEGRNALQGLRARAQAGDQGTGEGAVLALALRLEAAGDWKGAAQLIEEARPAAPSARSPLARYERLSAAMRADPAPSGAADRESALEEALLTENDSTLLYMGWTRVASELERSAGAAASSPGGSHLGVPSARWERRLRETTRRAWIACPDELVLPFGALLVERFARAPRDLDSLDKAFLGAVIRTMAQAEGADADPGRVWLTRSRATLGSILQNRPR